jgi:signal transduction histidine kinase
VANLESSLGSRPEVAIAPEVLAVDLLLRNVELMFRDEAELKGLEFRLRSSTALVTVDAMAAMRIVSNLVSNAVKYTQRGKVLIGCRRRGDRIAIVVADTGPGMVQAELASVMLEGERGAGAGEAEGSGLGLSIATRLAAQHDLQFVAASIPGRGTCFRVELPVSGSSGATVVPRFAR